MTSSNRNHIPDTIASHRARLELRKMLIDKLEANRLADGTTQLNYCKAIGMCKASYQRLMNANGQGATIDRLVLYLQRVGIEVTIAVSQPDDGKVWPDTEDRIDIIGSNGEFCGVAYEQASQSFLPQEQAGAAQKTRHGNPAENPVERAERP